MKTIYTIVFLFFSTARCYAQYGYDTIKVFFPLNVATLNHIAQQKLDSVSRIAKTRNILIYGYADYLGNEPANMDLAKSRAKNVKSYLLKQQIQAKQIIICEGIGEIERNLSKTKDGYPEDRYAAIFIKRTQATLSTTIAAKPPARKIKVSEIAPNGELIPILNVDKIKKDTTNSKTKNIKPLVVSTLKTTNKLSPVQPIKSRFEVLNDMKANEVMRIEAIHFQPTRHFITKESESILQELLQTLKDYPNLVINIEGHVCCMKGNGDALDTDTGELKLSENRARFIYQYLINNGIEEKRLAYVGHGKRRPIIPVEETEEDAQQNRRVEIRVVSN